jgi:hypothetical protein
MEGSNDSDPPATATSGAPAPAAAACRPITPAMARRYVAEEGACCPFCGGTDLLAEDAEADADSSWCEVDCPDCGGCWREVYSLSALDQLDEWGRVVATVDGTGPPPIEDLLAEGAAPGEPTRPVSLYVALPCGGDSGTWHTTAVDVPRRVPQDRLGEAAIHLLLPRLGREGAEVAFVGVHAIPHLDDGVA